MSSTTNVTLFGLLCSGLLLGCAGETVVGVSGELDVDLPQATLGAFAYDSSTAIADVNGDGTGDLIVWTNAAEVLDYEMEIPDFQPVGVFVFFGGPDGFEGELGPADADITLTLPDAGTFVGRVATQDLDGDGSAELIVHVAAEASPYFWPMPVDPFPTIHGPSTGVYVVDGGALSPGVHELATVGQHTSAYAFATEYMVQSTYALRDLDGAPGEEFLTEPYRLTDIGNTFINVRSLSTGETSGRLLAPANTYLDVRGVLDHDGDGAADVIAMYVETDDRNPNRWPAWRDVGIAIFYGPIVGDVTLDDAGTLRAFLLPAGLAPWRNSILVGGAPRTVVGDFCGDGTEDLLVTSHGYVSDRRVFCVPGGSRDPDQILLSQTNGKINLRLTGPDWLVAVPATDEVRSRIFVMGSEMFAFLAPELRTGTTGPVIPEEVVNTVPLSYDTPEESPLFTSLGGALGDLNGDGELDLALGSKARELEAESFVYVIYGFGG